MAIYKGSCHCGQVQFEVECDLAQTLECNCSICRNKGAIYSATLKNNFKITQGKEALTLYQFGTKTAIHHFCNHCGIHPFVNPRFDPKQWLINIRCLHEVELEEAQPDLFDGQNWEAAVKALLDKK